MKILGLNLKRLNRGSYVLTIFVSMFAFVAVGLILGAIFNSLLGPIDTSEPDSPHPLGYIPFLALWFVYYAFCTAQRFRDVNVSGWVALLAFVPYIGAILSFVLFFIPGTSGANKYGDRQTGIRVMGLGSNTKPVAQQTV